jgi:hypothetical protein
MFHMAPLLLLTLGACLILWLIGCLALYHRCRRYGLAGARAALVFALMGGVIAASAFTPRAYWLLPLWLGSGVIVTRHLAAKAARHARHHHTFHRRPII